MAKSGFVVYECLQENTECVSNEELDMIEELVKHMRIVRFCSRKHGIADSQIMLLYKGKREKDDHYSEN